MKDEAGRRWYGCVFCKSNISIRDYAAQQTLDSQISTNVISDMPQTNGKALYEGMRKVNYTDEITAISDTRTVNLKAGGTADVAEASFAKAPNAVLVLWDEQIQKVRVGDTVSVENGYTTAFRGKVQLNVGRYGKLSVE